MEPQPELVRPYVATLSGTPDAPAESVAPAAQTVVAEPVGPPTPWPTERDLPPVRPAFGHGTGRDGQHPDTRRRRRRSPGLTVALVLGAVTALGLLVMVTTDGKAPHGSAPGAAPAALPTPGGSRGTPTAGTSPGASGARQRPHASPSAAGSVGSSAVAVGAPSPSGASGTPASPSASAVDGTLRPGDRGPAVVRLQRLLFQQGFTYVQVTGVYDAATTRGVTQLQHDRGLTGDPTGVYGPVSRAALDPGN